MYNDKRYYFNFKEFDSDYLLTNDTGRFAFVSKTDFQKLIDSKFADSDELLNKLVDNYFVYNSRREIFVDNVSFEVRKQKSYLFEGTQLHIFILTKNCNQKCIYCQASANCENDLENNMTIETAEKAVDIAFQSPSKDLTFEFQGGEPLLNFTVLKHIVEYTQFKNTNKEKNITFNLVSNLIALDKYMLDFLLIT